MSVTKKSLILVAIILIPVFWVLFWKKGKVHYKKLPINGIYNNTDTTIYKIPKFTFTNQLGNIITEKDFENNIYIANFFFTSCPSICPKMMTNFSIVYDRFKKNTAVKFLSHSVDPENDTIEKLKKYSDKLEINPDKWMLVRADKEYTYRLAQNFYKVNTVETTNKKTKLPDFIHSEKLILVDKNRQIRGKGWYDSNNMKDILLLIDDIKVLLKEYHDKK